MIIDTPPNEVRYEVRSSRAVVMTSNDPETAHKWLMKQRETIPQAMGWKLILVSTYIIEEEIA